MTKLLSCALLAGLAAGTALAGPGGSKGLSHSAPIGGSQFGGTHMSAPPRSVNHPVGSVGGNYHLTHGKSFSGGTYHPGRNHSHWTYWGYSSRYGCYCYWCPYTSGYYYWCPSASCYYPISYFASAPVVPFAVPVATAAVVTAAAPVVPPAPVQVQVQTQAQTQVQGPGFGQAQAQAQQQGAPPVGVPPLP